MKLQELDEVFHALVKTHRAYTRGDQAALEQMEWPRDWPRKREMYSIDSELTDDICDFWTACAGWIDIMKYATLQGADKMQLEEGIDLLKKDYRRLKRTPGLEKLRANNPKSLKILKTFAYLCDEANKENIEFIVANLQKDIRKMRDEKRSEKFIGYVVGWQVFAKTMIPIAWDGFCRLIGAVFPVTEIIRKMIGLN